MQRNLYKILILYFCLGLSTILYPLEKPSFLQNATNTTISCLHWIFCPYCLLDSKRQITKFQAALEANDPQVIKHIIQRRDINPNQQLPDGSLPIIYAARKAHLESIKQLLALGSDVNSQMQGNYPSSLIAICAAEKLPPEQVYKIVHVLLDHGADPTRSCILLTDTEAKEFGMLRQEFQQDPTKEKEILARIPQNWFSPRTALDFAVKHKYAATTQILRQALANHQKGIKPDKRTNNHESENN